MTVWFGILLPGCATSGKPLNLSVPQFSYLQNGDNVYHLPHRTVVKIECLQNVECRPSAGPEVGAVYVGALSVTVSLHVGIFFLKCLLMPSFWPAPLFCSKHLKGQQLLVCQWFSTQIISERGRDQNLWKMGT